MQFDIPVNHLVKVAGHLARTKWIQATRGRNGGIRLAVEPSNLKLGVVLRELEGDAELVGCDSRGCSLHGACNLRGALHVGLRAFYATMDDFTLADMVGGATGTKILDMHRSFLKSLPQPPDNSRVS